LEQTAWYQLFFLAITIDFLIASVWLIIFVWWINLPSLMVFAAMYPSLKANPLVKYPRLVEFISVTNTTLALVLIFLFIFVLVCFFPSSLYD